MVKTTIIRINTDDMGLDRQIVRQYDEETQINTDSIEKKIEPKYDCDLF